MYCLCHLSWEHCILCVLCWVSSFCYSRFTLHPLHLALCPGTLNWMNTLTGLLALWRLVGFGPRRTVARYHSEGREWGVLFIPSAFLRRSPGVCCYLHIMHLQVTLSFQTCHSTWLSYLVWKTSLSSHHLIELEGCDSLAAGSPGFLLYPFAG